MIVKAVVTWFITAFFLQINQLFTFKKRKYGKQRKITKRRMY